MINETEIKALINDVKCNQDDYGFEVYAVVKGDSNQSQMRRIAFYEREECNIRLELKKDISQAIFDGICDTNFLPIEELANDQRCFYILEQNDEYKPFSFISPTANTFKGTEIANTTGIIFRITKNRESVIWVYQHVWPMTIPNKSKKNVLAKALRIDNTDIFEKIKEPLLSISRKFDLLIIQNHLVFKNISLMENVFGLQIFIKARAQKVLEYFSQNSIVFNSEKIKEYMERGNGKLIYSKRLMRIEKSFVFGLSDDELKQKINEYDRWQNVFTFNNGKIELKSFKDVENIIDLYDERFTKSPITGVEYDTDVKKATTTQREGTQQE